MNSEYIYKAIIATLSVISIIFLILSLGDISHYFWDLNVYSRAVNDYLHGGNPYRTDIDLYFVYHPYVLILFAMIDNILSLKVFLALCYVLSTLFFLVQLLAYCREEVLRLRIERRNSINWFLIPSFVYGGVGLTAFSTGNLSLFIHFFLLGAFLNGLRKQKQLNNSVFFVGILIASLIKPYFLSYFLLLPFLLSIKKSFIVAVFITLVLSIVWVSATYFSKELYLQFLSTLSSQTFGTGDMGYAIFGLTQKYLSDKGALIAHVIIMLSVLGYLAFITQKRFSTPFVSIMVSITIALIVLLNPRMKDYDFLLAILFLNIFVYLYIPGSSLKPIALSLFIASLPIIYSVAQGLGFSVILLIRLHQFQILGLLLLLFYIAKHLAPQFHPPFVQTQEGDRF